MSVLKFNKTVHWLQVKHFSDYVNSKASFFLGLTDFKRYCCSVVNECIMMPFSVTGACTYQLNSQGGTG